MRLKKLSLIYLPIALLALALAVPSVASAEDIQDIIEAFSAKEEKFRKEIQDMTLFQVGDMTTPQGPTQMTMKYYKKGEKFRVDVKIQMPKVEGMPQGMEAMEMISVYDGQKGAMANSMTGIQPMDEDEIKQMKAGITPWEMAIKDAKLIGSEKLDGRDCWVLDMSNQEQAFSKVWLDKDELIVLKARSEGAAGQGAAQGQGPAEIFFKDYREIASDYSFPYLSEIHQAGQIVATYKVQELTTNTGLPDDLFDPDKLEAPAGPNLEEMMKQMQEQMKKQQQ